MSASSGLIWPCEDTYKSDISSCNRTRQCALGPIVRPNLFLWSWSSNLDIDTIFCIYKISRIQIWDQLPWFRPCHIIISTGLTHHTSVISWHVYEVGGNYWLWLQSIVEVLIWKIKVTCEWVRVSVQLQCWIPKWDYRWEMRSYK